MIRSQNLLKDSSLIIAIALQSVAKLWGVIMYLYQCWELDFEGVSEMHNIAMCSKVKDLLQDQTKEKANICVHKPFVLSFHHKPGFTSVFRLW